MEAIGVKALKGEKGYSTLERNSCRPSFDVCGIWGGYTGKVQKPFFHRRHTPKYLVVWFLIRTMKSSQNCLSITLTASLLNMYR